jgi:hypothetical protein
MNELLKLFIIMGQQGVASAVQEEELEIKRTTCNKAY